MRKTALSAAVLAAVISLPLAAHAAEPVQHDAIFPPWQHGENNDAAQRGLSFTVPEVDDLVDFHGDVSARVLHSKTGGIITGSALGFVPRSIRCRCRRV